MNKQSGAGFVELLISLFLTGVITLILVRQYVSIKQQYHYLQATIARYIDWYFVSDVIRNSIRQAGFTPCLRIEHLTAVDRRDEQPILAGIAYQSDIDLPEMQVYRMSAYFNTVVKINSVTQLSVTNRYPLHAKQTVLIADCSHAEVHRIENVRFEGDTQTVHLEKSLLFEYTPPTYIGAWLEEKFVTRINSQGETVLFYKNKHAEALSTDWYIASIRHLSYPNGIRVVLHAAPDQFVSLDTRIRGA